jgi:uncharacterized protein (TIGR03083 family)
MDDSRLLACLEVDYRRIRDVVAGHLALPVSSCPGWTMADLTRHVGEVYLHKVEMMRQGRHPDGWPPASFHREEPIALLDRAYAELRAEFAARRPEDVSKTWYGPDQTVRFWIRRMAQESVIHRIDAELGAGVRSAPVPDDLAIDGVDELLKVFLAHSFNRWPEDFTEALQGSPGRTFLIQADATASGPGVAWLVVTAPDHVTVQGGPGETIAETAGPDVMISGTPADILRWGWNRETPGEPSPVRIEGGAEALPELRECVVAATQ